MYILNPREVCKKMISILAIKTRERKPKFFKTKIFKFKQIGMLSSGLFCDKVHPIQAICIDFQSKPEFHCESR